MQLTWDEWKRAKTLEERGLDFARVQEIFTGQHVTITDDREDYGESRFFSVGFISERMCIAVWTQRGDVRRIISLRKANEREQAKYREYLERFR